MIALFIILFGIFAFNAVRAGAKAEAAQKEAMRK
jgi:preprotein translocase subunit YajC